MKGLFNYIFFIFQEARLMEEFCASDDIANGRVQFAEFQSWYGNLFVIFMYAIFTFIANMSDDKKLKLFVGVGKI
jgi:hypothetical protein